MNAGPQLWLSAALALCLLLALATDRLWGEPPASLHPVVWMGNYLAFCGRFTTRFNAAAAFFLGAAAWWLGAVVTGAATWVFQAWALRQVLAAVSTAGLSQAVGAAMGLAVFSWLLKTMFSWRMLREETLAVDAALRQSLQAGRQRLAMLVSRDTAALTEGEVRESVIESLAENLNDSVVAPLFWFVLFGLPGAAIYRFSNTADAMWGYRGFRHGVYWEWAGKWAARADDALSWLPARFTALLLAAAAGGLRWKVLRAEARKTPSPNSGWPMAAMALALGVCLHKPGVYALNPAAPPPTCASVAAAAGLASKVVALAATGAGLAVLSVAVLRFVP